MNNKSFEFSSLSEIDNIIQEEEEIFQKKPTLGLPEVSKLIDSAISKRQGDWRKHSFLERQKILHKRENRFTMSTQNIPSLDGSSYEVIHSSISQNIFSYLKMFSMQCRKTKNEWIYVTYIYIYLFYLKVLLFTFKSPALCVCLIFFKVIQILHPEVSR